MAVSLEAMGKAEDYSRYGVSKRWNAPSNSTVYKLVFDYNFHVLHGRQDSSDVLVRIDYSNDQGYWEDIVGE
jgi:hypothetical protein